MRTYPIFCPLCDRLVLDGLRCESCGWIRPSDSAAVGEIVGRPIGLPLQPAGASTPALVGNHLWLTGFHSGKGRLVSANPETGQMIVHDLPPYHIVRDLASGDGLVYAACGDAATVPVLGKLALALDGRTGSMVWEERHTDAYTLSPGAYNDNRFVYVTDTGDTWYREARTGHVVRHLHVAGSTTHFPPAIAGNLTLFTGSMLGKDVPVLVAWNHETFKIAWKIHSANAIVTPLSVGEDHVCYGTVDGVHCMSLNTGHSTWRKPFAPTRITRKGALTGPPVTTPTKVLFGGGSWIDDSPGYALYAVDLDSGTMAWSYTLAAKLALRPAVIGSTVVCADSKGTVLALDGDSGRLIWTTKLLGTPATCPVIDSDYVHIADQQGSLWRIRYRNRAVVPTEPPEAYEMRQAWEMAGTAYALQNKFSEAGRCYLVAKDGLHALQLFEFAGDQCGRAQALSLLGQWDAAIELYRVLGQEAAAAEVLVQAGCFAEAAVALESLKDFAKAGTAYEEAGRLLDAARCYSTIEDETALQRLVDDTGADAALAELLGLTKHWNLAVDLFLRLNRKANAARLLQEKGELRRAFEIWWRIGDWGQCRALAQTLRDKEAEARVCAQLRQYGEAASLYEELGQWAMALKYYDLAPSVRGSAGALAGLGRFEEAGDRLVQAQLYGEGARQYRRAAEQMMEQANFDRSGAAELLRRAAEAYSFGREKAEAQACHLAAARVLSEPVIGLADVKIGSALVVGHESRLQVVVENQGFGPARKVQIALDGGGFGYRTPTAAGNRVQTLACGETVVFQTGLTPIKPGSGVELRLHLSFEPLSGGTREVGPFQAFLTVQEPSAPGPTTIHIGSFEYIGPGGVHAQDVVTVRPTYGSLQPTGGASVASPASSTVSQLAGEVLHQVSGSRYARFCQVCGAPLIRGQSRCPNPECAAPLCIHCGTVLHYPGQDCPICGINLKTEGESK